ncbi:transcription factor atf21 [Diplogelasinospora grovesii]|uniref:Transcription factor atf21 n=1 Tax=Diplogelasinospora grovesii TaxID=303347 RepID=A0AAN6NFU7_9PEZI|nr:transcription factor atf21 [Diplogelasinospora grovesii]
METLDTPSHFFSDCLDFEDTNPYQSPDHDAGDEGDGSQAFQPDHSTDGIGGSPFPTHDNLMRADSWDAFGDSHGGGMAVHHRPLFVDPGLYGEEEEHKEHIKAQIQALSAGMSSRPSTRRTSTFSQRTSESAGASTDITPPDQDSPKRRKTRRMKKDSNMAEEEQKRSKFLERNRIAASKCREKKKQYVTELEETKLDLEAQHAHLQMEYNGLLGEVSGLKHDLMAHAKCNDPNIDRWLNNEARRFVQTTNELFGQTFAEYIQTSPSLPELSTASSHSRNASIASTYQALAQGMPQGRGSDERRGSIAYSHGSPLQLSPTDSTFSTLPSVPHVRKESSINYDHMPDDMFKTDQSVFGEG